MNSTALVIREYEGAPVFFQTDAYLNATEVAKQFGRHPKDYFKTERTQEYISAIRRKILVNENQLVVAKPGAPATGGGTWIHPKLALDFARWLNADFAVWCDEQIALILRGEPSPAGQRQDSAARYGTQALRLIADELDALRHDVFSIQQQQRWQGVAIAQLQEQVRAKPHRLLSVDDRQTVMNLSLRAAPTREHPDKTRASPRPHTRRAHWRRLPDGRQIPVRAAAVNVTAR